MDGGLFGFHEGLVRGSYTLTQVRCRLAEETLEEWLHQPGKVYVIDRDGEATGFLRIIVTLRKELDGSKYEKELSIEETQLHY